MASSRVNHDPFNILTKDLVYHERLGRGGSGTVYRATLRKPDGTSVQVCIPFSYMFVCLSVCLFVLSIFLKNLFQSN